MLGRLFSSAASSLNPSTPGSPTGRPKHPHESVQEEIHTRNLLFPDPSQLHRPQPHVFPFPPAVSSQTTSLSSTCDSGGDVDLESPRDIRIIIAQDATALQPDKAVLFDSKPLVGDSSKVGQIPKTDDARTNPPSNVRAPASVRPQSSRSGLAFPRKSDSTSDVPPSPSGAFGLGALQRASRRPLDVAPETNQSRLNTQHKNEMRMFLDCMFGSAPLSYKGPSTKIHVMPIESRPTTASSHMSASLGDGGSWGRVEGRRQSRLAQSFTPLSPRLETISPKMTAADGGHKGAERRTILVTRMFSVMLPEIKQTISNEQKPEQDESGSRSYPFPDMKDNSSKATPGSKRTLKQVKTPMFAASIILSLPVARSSLSTARSGASSYAGSRMSENLGLDHFASSLDADRRHPGTPDLTQSYDSISQLSSATGDRDDGMDIITQHWDLISRVLYALQTSAQEAIYKHLTRVAIASPEPPRPAPPNSLTMLRKPMKTNQQIIQLVPGALAQNEEIPKLVTALKTRIILGLRIPRVITGQGRWALWREEARWIGRWATGKEQNFFFFNVLTSFLGTHREWLEVLGPKSYRRKSRKLQRSTAQEEQPLRDRTVIVSNDKMAARRLLFLLGAFLPSSRHPFDSASPRRPNTSTSFRGYSQSPPSGPTFREGSLRRSMNRRGASRGSTRGHLRTMSVPTQAAVVESEQEEDAHPRLDSHSRTSSSENPVEAEGMPIPQSNGSTRKSSVATTATTTPAATIRQFAALRMETNPELSTDHRRGSNSSLASMNLMQTLRRNDTSQSNISNDSQPASRWGSVISGFWSNRRSSTDNSDILPSSEDALGISGSHHHESSGFGKSQLQRMVDQVNQEHGGHDSFHEGEIHTVSTGTVRHLEGTNLPDPADTSYQAEYPSHIIDSPLKMSVDSTDGVIDVEIGDLPSSFGSPLSSFSTRGFLSSNPLDSLRSPPLLQSPTCPFTLHEADNPPNVAGYLKRFHADFALQALPPQPSLEADIKAAMRLEPSSSASANTWTDVCTTLLANAHTFTIKRIKLQRRLAPFSPSAPTPAPENPSVKQTITPYHPPPPLSPSNASATSTELESRFVIEPIFNIDDVLVDAIERILLDSGSSTPLKSTSSRSSSQRRGRQPAPSVTSLANKPSSSSQSQEAEVEAEIEADRASIPRKGARQVPHQDCAQVVLGSLEEIAREVFADDSRTADDQDQVQDDRADRESTALSRDKESTLREGIRRWKTEVERGVGSPSSASASASAT
jgi:hypothetical protein